MIDKPDVYREFSLLLSQIPEGYVSTYGDMALQLGDIAASTAVSDMLREEELVRSSPYYRVIGSDGRIEQSSFPNEASEKTRKLILEGVRISRGKVENLEKVRFTGFLSNFPLKRYRKAIGALQLEEDGDVPENLRSMDISYLGRKGIGVAVDLDDDLSYEVIVRDVKSPYIPNYLYLREGDIYESLVRGDRINIIDGNGVLHKDGKGIATIVGATKHVCTVGLAKSLLLGVVRENQVLFEEKIVARKVGKYYVSPGYRIGLDRSVDALINNRYFPQTKLPDRLSRRYRDEILPAQYSL